MQLANRSNALQAAAALVVAQHMPAVPAAAEAPAPLSALLMSTVFPDPISPITVMPPAMSASATATFEMFDFPAPEKMALQGEVIDLAAEDDGPELYPILNYNGYVDPFAAAAANLNPPAAPDSPAHTENGAPADCAN